MDLSAIENSVDKAYGVQTPKGSQMSGMAVARSQAIHCWCQMNVTMHTDVQSLSHPAEKGEWIATRNATMHDPT